VPIDERATEALGHVQRALLEMIEAAKATLDLVEDVVADPQSLAAVVAAVGHLVQGMATSARHPEPDERAPSGVERIPIR
jgi:hypothetical protein